LSRQQIGHPKKTTTSLPPTNSQEELFFGVSFVLLIWLAEKTTTSLPPTNLQEEKTLLGFGLFRQQLDRAKFAGRLVLSFLFHPDERQKKRRRQQLPNAVVWFYRGFPCVCVDRKG